MNDPADLLSLLLGRASGAPQPWATMIAQRLIRYGGRSGINASADLGDLLVLWLSVEPQPPGSPYMDGLMRVVLSNSRWPVAARMAFLRRHLNDRHATRADDAAAPRLFGAAEEAAR